MPFARTSFYFRHEIYTDWTTVPPDHGYDLNNHPESGTLVTDGIANMMSFHEPVDSGMTSYFAARPGIGFELFMWCSVKFGHTAAELNTQAANGATLAASVGLARSHFALMPEWDQAGGTWVDGGNRPRYDGMTRQQAYATFTNYYMGGGQNPLQNYLNQAIGSRPWPYMAICDYGPNTFIACQMGQGVDIVALERAIDELGDTSTGLAYVRGAARLYDRPWGIDVSGWRTIADTPTQYSASGVQTGGWSASYLRRHCYIAYMGGAHKVLIEPTIWFLPGSGNYNPLGVAYDAFADFALTRHPHNTIGTPVVPLAIIFDFYSGFDTKHGPYNQADGVWYQDIAYSSGDYMTNNFFKVAYPNHWLHGTIPGDPFGPYGTPQTATNYQNYMAGGGDPRPYEPMPTTRWGDTMDITLNTASASLLSAYRIVALMGGVVIDTNLRAALQTFAQAGGTVVANTSQVTAADQTLLGVTLGGASVSGGNSTWLGDGTVYTEPAYTYKPVTLTTATALARTTGNAPLITQNIVGSGKVILTTPDYLQSTARTALLSIGVRLFDELYASVRPATVNGPALEFLFNTASGKLITTLINSSGTVWNGTIVAPISGTVTAVKEYIGDTSPSFTVSAGVVTVNATVPIYDVKVYAIEYTASAARNVPGTAGSYGLTGATTSVNKTAGVGGYLRYRR